MSKPVIRDYGVLQKDEFGDIVTFNTENISDAVPISSGELATLVKILAQKKEINSELLEILMEEKTPYLFSSDDLTKLINITESLKTKVNIIAMIGPRLTDPRRKAEYFTGLFKFTAQKDQVKEILKARSQILNSVMFNKGGPLLAGDNKMKRGNGRRPTGGPRGRGGGGRGGDRNSVGGGGNKSRYSIAYAQSHFDLNVNEQVEVEQKISKSVDSTGGEVAQEAVKEFPRNTNRSPAPPVSVTASLRRSLSKSLSEDEYNIIRGSSSSGMGSKDKMKKRASRIMQARLSLEITPEGDGEDNQMMTPDKASLSQIIKDESMKEENKDQAQKKAGFLVKKARSAFALFNPWHTQYFELCSGRLAYYETKEKVKQGVKKGDFSLAYASAVYKNEPGHKPHIPEDFHDTESKENTDNGTTGNGTTVVCITFGSGEKDLVLDAGTREKAYEWLKAIKEHCSYASGHNSTIS